MKVLPETVHLIVACAIVAGSASPALTAPGATPPGGRPGVSEPGGALASQLALRALAVLDGNLRRTREGGREYRYTCPDSDRYPYQWLWDSCFHAIGLRWVDPGRARDEIESLVAMQWENGMIPNLGHMNGGGLAVRLARLMQRAGRNSSGITQPPIIAETVLAIHESSPDRSFLERVFPALHRYYEWIARERDPDGEGLPIIYHPWESGADDSPRWDPLLGIQEFSRWRFNIRKFKMLVALSRVGFDGRRLGDRAPFLVRGVDVACYYHKNLKAMARLAAIVGRPDLASVYSGRAMVTRRAILGRMWNEEAGVFVDLLGPKAIASTVKTPFGLMPLYAGIVDATTAGRLRRALSDPALFGAPHPVPTVALSSNAFDPEAYWRGTAWVNVNWFLIRGLEQYGFASEARDLSARTLNLVDKGGFKEYFNPKTGVGYGAGRFSWTAALAIDLLQRAR